MPVPLIGTGRSLLARPFGIPRAGLLTEYRFDQGSGTSLTDYSGNGNTGVFGGGLGAGYYPTWSGGGLLFDAAKNIGVPAAGVANARTVIFAGSFAPVARTQALMSATGGSGTQNWNLQPVDNRPVCGTDWWTNPYYGSVIPLCSGAGSIAFADDGKVYINGVRCAMEWGGASSTTTPTITGTTDCRIGLGAGQFYLTGTLYYVLIYNRVLSAAEIAQCHAAIAVNMAARGITFAGIPQTLDRTLIAFDGNSIALGVGGNTTNGLMTQVKALLSGTYDWANLGRPGGGSQIMTDHAAEIDAVLAASTGAEKFLVVYNGVNAAYTAGEYTLLLNYCTARKAAGWTKLIVGTGLPSTGTDAARATFNASIAGQASPPWDAIFDWAADLNMGQNGQNLDATYYGDGLHPTGTGYGIGAAILKTALNGLGIT